MTADSSTRESTGRSNDGDGIRLSRAIELTPHYSPERVATLARRAESVGFDAAFASNHYFNRDPFVTLTRMAAETETIRLGPGVVNPYESHPVTLASRIATLDEVAAGRAVFGVGPGDRSALAALGIDRDRPLERVLETIEVVRALLAGETVTHDGTFVVRDASLNLEPRTRPVYVGAQGPDMLRMSAKYADGVLVNGSHPTDLEWAAERIAEGFADRPDELGSFETLAFTSVSVADDAPTAREAARPPVAFIAGSAPPPVLDRHDIDRKAVETVRDGLEAGALGDAFEAVTPRMIDAFAIAGTTAQVGDRFEALSAFVDGIVVGSPLGPESALETSIERAGEALDRAGIGGGNDRLSS